MRYMMIIKSDEQTEAGTMPSSEDIAAMGRFNDELIKAGVLLAGEGLQPSSRGARVTRKNGETVVTDGPFAEAKELIAGFWLIDVKSYEEALNWTRRIPIGEGAEVELRKVFDVSDFAEDEVSKEYLDRERAWRAENEKPVTK